MQNIHVELTSANTIDANGRLLIPQTIICGKISFIDLASHYDVWSTGFSKQQMQRRMSFAKCILCIQLDFDEEDAYRACIWQIVECRKAYPFLHHARGNAVGMRKKKSSVYQDDFWALPSLPSCWNFPCLSKEGHSDQQYSNPAPMHNWSLPRFKTTRGGKKDLRTIVAALNAIADSRKYDLPTQSF